MNATRKRGRGVAVFRKRGETRKTREGEVQLGRAAGRAVVLELADEVGSERGGVDEAEQRAARISIRHDGAGRDLFAARENDAARDAILHRNVRHLGIRADLDAERARSLGERFRERAEAAARKRGGQCRVTVERRLQKELRARSAGPRAREARVNAARGNRRAQEIAFEPLRDEVGDRHRTPP